MVYQDVMRNASLEPESKSIYAYLACFAGDKDNCHPSRKLMLKELKMSEQRFSKYMNALLAAGVVKVTRERDGNIFGKNIYTITHKVIIAEENAESGCSEIPHTENEYTENKHTECEHARNMDTNNNTNRDREYINYQQIADMYNNTCVSFPRVTKLSDSRKKAIKARLKQYSVEDFQRLFTMAEESSFLKGKNDRNWSANFDWLIKDANMAKVLDGNYIDKSTSTRSHTITEEERARLEAERIANMPEWMEHLQNREPREDDPFK